MPLTLSRSVTMGKLLNCSVPQFNNPWNRHNSVELMWILNGVINVKSLKQGLQYSNCLVNSSYLWPFSKECLQLIYFLTWMGINVPFSSIIFLTSIPTFYCLHIPNFLALINTHSLPPQPCPHSQQFYFDKIYIAYSSPI